MTRAMLARVRRLERTLRSAAPETCTGAQRPEGLAIMRRLALHPDLFDQFAAIAESAASGIDAGTIGRLAAALAAREAQAWRLRSAQIS